MASGTMTTRTEADFRARLWYNIRQRHNHVTQSGQGHCPLQHPPNLCCVLLRRTAPIRSGSHFRSEPQLLRSIKNPHTRDRGKGAVNPYLSDNKPQNLHTAVSVHIIGSAFATAALMGSVLNRSSPCPCQDGFGSQLPVSAMIRPRRSPSPYPSSQIADGLWRHPDPPGDFAV